jgi:soluble lytic murein transglycosylase
MTFVDHLVRVVCLIAAVGVVGAPTASIHAWDGPCAVDERLDETTVPFCRTPDGASPAVHTDWSQARHALARARAARLGGRAEQALLELAVVDRAAPRVSDRIALDRGDVLLALGRPAAAKAAFESAIDSLDTAVAARARVGRVRSMIRGDERGAQAELNGLLLFYPELPDAANLRFDLGESSERTGNVHGAVAVYRALDLDAPGSPLAARARARLEAIARGGTAVRELPVDQQITRLETLARRGPHSMARDEVERLLEVERMSGAHRARVNLVAARIARIEGRFDDARSFLQRGAAAGAQGSASREQEVERLQDAASASVSREQQAAQQRIAELKGRRAWRAVPQMRLLQIVQIGARAGLAEPVDEALAVLASSARVPPVTAFQAALVASGLANDEHVEALFGKVARVNNARGVAARYHQARALERLGRHAEAEAEFLRVIEQDRSETRWYAMWSEQRLLSVHEAMLGRCGPPVTEAGRPTAVAAASGESSALASLDAMVVQQQAERYEGMREASAARRAIPPVANPDAVARMLEPLVQSHGEAYPWFARAQDLVRLGDRDAAADELHEAYLAWRDARGRTLRRVGVEAVYRGVEAPRRPVPFAVRRDRRALSTEAQSSLAEIAALLGDEGTAVGLTGWSRAQTRPRAYEHLVEDAARRHGLDPNLLLAVMRVESVYQRRIVSYAGAVGLMQIMPRTGRHIAHAMGIEDFTTAELLRPEVNLDFAAWYLASLIERFQGRLALAIASYNGGPHNVRRWIESYGQHMPLDAFLEEIPFDQTHRYVRRVLTHYAAYRGQQGLPMERLSTRLPHVEPDPLAF